MASLKKDWEAATKGSKRGYVDKTGKTVVPFIYDIADDFKGGIAIVRNHNKCGLIDKTGKVIVPLIYDGMGSFDSDQSGLARVQIGNKWGFINKKGKEIVPCIYIKANFFSEGLALIVTDKGESGYVDATGKLIIPFTKYTRAENFRNGKAEVRKGNDVFYINKQGQTVN
ncbi:MAG: WG repeat-containing protein [Flavobacterium sp.]|nr:WG repeat-containing protein [Flavobacterium sp.]